MATASFDKAQLAQVVERIEALEGDKAAAADDLREVYKGAKEAGFDVKAIRRVIKLRKMDESQRAAEATTRDLESIYREALGDTPLEAAIKGAG